METIPHPFPLTGAQKAAFQAAAPESGHLSFLTNDCGGASSVPQEWREHTIILLGYVPPEQLEAFPDLRWVQSRDAGADPYLVPSILPGGVHLISIVGTYSPTVPKHVLVMLLAIYKRLPACRDRQRAHVWADLGSAGSLAGKTVLVADAGDIGRHFARLVRTLRAQWVIGLRRGAGCPVGGFDEIYDLGALNGLLPQADMVALALPHTPETAGLMSKVRLLAMRPGAILLSAGRGSAVDCTALAEVLCSGRLLGVGPDVTNPEPLPPEHPLWEAPSPPLTPHTARGYNRMEATLERIKAIFLDNLRRHVEGRTLHNQVC